MGQGVPEPLPNKLVTDPGKTAVDSPDTVANKRLLLYQNKPSCILRVRILPCHNFFWENFLQSALVFHKIGNRQQQFLDFVQPYHGLDQVLKMHHPRFFCFDVFSVFFLPLDDDACPFPYGDIFAELGGGTDVVKIVGTHHYSMPDHASNADIRKKFDRTIYNGFLLKEEFSCFRS